jgi:hypothetical protein
VKIEDNEPPEIIVTGDEKVGRRETVAAAFGKSSSCSYESSLVNGDQYLLPQMELGCRQAVERERERRHEDGQHGSREETRVGHKVTIGSIVGDLSRFFMLPTSR